MRRDADAEGAAAVLDLGQELARIMPDPRARADLLHTLQLVAADADQEREGDKPGSGPMGASADSLRKPWFGAPPARIGSLASQSFSLTEQASLEMFRLPHHLSPPFTASGLLLAPSVHGTRHIPRDTSGLLAPRSVPMPGTLSVRRGCSPSQRPTPPR